MHQNTLPKENTIEMKAKNAFQAIITAVAGWFAGVLPGHAYSFVPLVTCYSMQENSCATQAWDATQDNKGTLFFGTSDGLLSFDGVRWENHALPGISTVRSVKAIGNRVYVGAYEEFGYFERDEFGVPVYHSLNNLIENYDFHDDEFWSIVPHGRNIYFQSFRSILRYDGNKVETITPEEAGPLNLFNNDGTLYSQLIYKGLNRFDGKYFVQAVSRGAFGNSDVVGIMEGKNKEFLLCTEKEGLFAMKKGGQPRKFFTEADNELKANCINRAIQLRDGTIVAGTLRNGVYGIDTDGKLLWHYNIENGLGNNTVLGLHEDRTGNIWVMLDHGISLIHAGLSYSFLKPNAGEPYIGMTYAMMRNGDKFYIGTNQGLYVYSFSDKKIKSNELAKSQIWHIDAFDNQLLIGGGTLSGEISADRITNLTTNGSTDIKKGRIHNQEVLIESSYYALRVHRHDRDGRWSLSHTVSGFGAPVRQIEIDNDGSIWCAHSSRGVLHVELSRDLKSIESMETFMDAGPGHERPTSFVMKIRGQIVVSDGDSLYRYDSQAGNLKVFSALYKDLLMPNEIYSSTPVDDKLFWLSSRKAYTLVEYRDGHYQRMLSVPLDHLTLQSNGVNNRVYVDDERNCYFALNNGIGCIRPERDKAKLLAAPMAIASVEHVTGDGITERLVLKPADGEKVESRGNIEFRLTYPSYNFRAPKFLYTLQGPDEITTVTEEPEVSYVGLSHGDYIFTASLIDDDGKAIAHTDYRFTVTRPAYLSYWAMSGYVLALAVIGMGLSKLYTRRQMKRQSHEHEIERVAQNVKILEQERIISEQQKQLLQNELDQKSKELASMALQAGYKDQVITNLRETITGQRRKGQLDSREIDNLIKTINSDIGKTEFWNIFHNNFDLIHENFFKNLRERFPDLSPTDLKFCALMRLNMSTKDIAGFTHLTIRGVETARYRIRRKLGLDTKTSIVQFLIDFK